MNGLINNKIKVTLKPRKERKAIMNKKLKVCIIVIVLIFVALIGLSFTNEKSIIIGSWEVAEKSINENLNGYPEDVFIIYENGTFTSDGYHGTYSINNNTITMNIAYYSRTYKYELLGNTLKLKLINDYDEPEIYYKRGS